MSKNEEPKIQRVSDNFEKQDAYRRLKGRRTKAIKNNFWFEAILIDYAIMEDRFWSLLYYLGVLANRDATKVNCKKTKTDIREIYLGENNQNKQIKLANISTKLDLIEKLMKWCEDNNPESGYLYCLKTECDKRIDYAELYELFGNIREWCSIRNEIIHGAMNKNIDSLEETAKRIEPDGFQYACQIDNYVKALKKQNTIRKEMKMSLK